MIRVKNNDWHTKKIAIKDKTKDRNGIPTALNVMRQFSDKRLILK